jgi:hypothetical protein
MPHEDTLDDGGSEMLGPGGEPPPNNGEEA